jgi:single-strand DNA-binding protein
MSSYSKTIIIGNLTKDPTISQGKDKDYCLFSVAVNNGYGDKQTTDFYFCKAYDKLAQNLCDYMRKGDRVLVEGQMRSYRKDGEDLDRWTLQAWNIVFLTNRSEGGGRDQRNDRQSSNNSRNNSNRTSNNSRQSSRNSREMEETDEDMPF